MNLNELAVEITTREGGANNLSIADVKEVLRVFAEVVTELPEAECEALLLKMLDKE